MNRPLITIGLTCFNAEDTIGRAIASALMQTWSNFELVIVDDCSTDRSVDRVEELIAGKDRARLIRHGKNVGPAGARNSILKAAKGEFIVFFDDDDESHPERLTVQYQRLTEYEATTGASHVACYASGRREYPNGYQLKIEAVGSKPEPPIGRRVADYLLFNGRVPGFFYGGGVPTCALFLRRSILTDVGGFDPSLRRVEDIDLAIRLALAGGHFIGCREELYLQHATDGTDKTPEMNLVAELQLVEKYADYLHQRKSYEYARDWFKIRYYHFSRQHLTFVAALARFLLRHPVRGIIHLRRSAPARALHERRMRAERGTVR